MTWEPPHHEFCQISANCYYLSHGDHDRPAIGIIIGEEATMLVDAGNSNHHATVVMDFLQELAETRDVAPIRYLILTHWHWDHSFGIVGYETAFHDDHSLVGYPVVIGHELTTKALRQQQKYEFNEEALQERVDDGREIEFIQKFMKKEYPDLTVIDIRTPKLSYKQGLEIDLGDLLVTIDHVDCDHAEDSSLIYIEDQSISNNDKYSILFLGDSLYPNLYHHWTYTVDKVRSTLDKLDLYSADLYVDAHDIPWKATDFQLLVDDFRAITNYFDTTDIVKQMDNISQEADLGENQSRSNHVLYQLLDRIDLPSNDESTLDPTQWREVRISIVQGFYNTVMLQVGRKGDIVN